MNKSQKLDFLKKTFLIEFNQVKSDANSKNFTVLERDKDNIYLLCNGDLKVYEGEFVESLGDCLFRVTKQAMINLQKEGFVVSLSEKVIK